MRTAGDHESSETLEGLIQRIAYQSAESGYVVLQLLVGHGAEVVAVGTMPGPMAGEDVRLRGHWQVHSRWGRRFCFDSYELLRRAGPEALAVYLAEAIKGIGPELARRLVEHFGEDTVAALEEGEERLLEVPGIGPKKAASLAEAWHEHRHIHELMAFLRSRGLSPSLAARVHRAYGPRAVEVIERQPYRLAREIRGVGFLTADRIAREAGFSREDPSRVQAGLLHVLGAALVDGHLYLTRAELVERGAELLRVPRDLVEEQIRAMVAEGELVAETDGAGEEACYVPGLLACEKRVAWLLRGLAEAKAVRAPGQEQAEGWLRRFEEYSGLELNDDQRTAAMTSCSKPVSVITGGPGTGKTTVTRAITWVWRRTGRRVVLCAPTGRAAKRLEEVTEQEAFTIHRLLGYRPDGGFTHGPDQPLPYDLIVVDEASMVDMPLAASLLSAVAAGSSVVLVGDADQLPPVGPGAFFDDVVSSGGLPALRLTQVYRQAERSLIVTNAHRLTRGEGLILPRPQTWKHEDMLWVEVGGRQGEVGAPGPEEREERVADSVEAQQTALEKIEKTVTRNLPRLGFAPGDIQVLSPMRRGLLGVGNLNTHLQRLLNPPAPDRPELRRGDTVFRLGDRVLQTANNYDKGVFNGEIGHITAVDPQGRLTVDFAIGRIEYERGEADQLELAYALTVHKSQGSEYPAVVLAIHSSHYIMLRRNLLYTALTRAERMAVLVGDSRGLWRAIRTAPARERNTRLAARLRGDLPADPSEAPPLPGLVGEE